MTPCAGSAQASREEHGHGGSRLLWDVGDYVPVDAVSYFIRLEASCVVCLHTFSRFWVWYSDSSWSYVAIRIPTDSSVGLMCLCGPGSELSSPQIPVCDRSRERSCIKQYDVFCEMWAEGEEIVVTIETDFSRKIRFYLDRFFMVYVSSSRKMWG